MLVANTIKAWRRYLKIANITPDPEPEPRIHESIRAPVDAPLDKRLRLGYSSGQSDLKGSGGVTRAVSSYRKALDARFCRPF
jgi:hypothetical protein